MLEPSKNDRCECGIKTLHYLGTLRGFEREHWGRNKTCKIYENLWVTKTFQTLGSTRALPCNGSLLFISQPLLQGYFWRQAIPVVGVGMRGSGERILCVFEVNTLKVSEREVIILFSLFFFSQITKRIYCPISSSHSESKNRLENSVHGVYWPLHLLHTGESWVGPIWTYQSDGSLYLESQALQAVTSVDPGGRHLCS